VTTSYQYDGLNPVMVNGSLMLEGLGLDQYFARITAGTVTSFLTDGLGSTIALTNSSGATTASYAYGPYGNVSASGSDSTPFQFTGRENDGAANLYYYRARYYNPTFGQFISADPIGLAGGINPYAYAGGNPISFTDPLGLCKKRPGILQLLAQNPWLLATIIATEVAGGGPEDPLADVAVAAEIAKAEEAAAVATEAAETADAATSGAESSLQAYRLSQQLAAEEAAGTSAPTSITSYSDHALEQIAERDGGIGVSQQALEDAFANPNAIQYAPSTYGPTFRFVGEDATVVVNPEGNVVTGWATSSLGITP
jgi:RHS repeat-associated protein